MLIYTLLIDEMHFSFTAVQVMIVALLVEATVNLSILTCEDLAFHLVTTGPCNGSEIGTASS